MIPEGGLKAHPPNASNRPGPFATAALLLTLALAAPPSASAELTQRGNLFVSFDGGIGPRALPRERLAPIEVRVAARVRTLSGERPPALRAIRIELNRAGRLTTAGLPVCHRRQIGVSTSAQALAACRGALVGTGRYAGRTSFPEQDAFPARGRILAFNSIIGCARADPATSTAGLRTPGRLWPSSSRTQGGRQGERTRVRDPQASDRGRRDAKCHRRPAILAHVYGTYPVPITRIVAFRIRRPARGRYGTVLHGSLPASINRWGYLRRISLRLHRTYSYRGRFRSYISAACSAPPGFRAATFPFARTSMAFSDGRRLSSTLVRACRVRR